MQRLDRHLDRHFTKKHKLSVKSPLYQRYKKTAKEILVSPNLSEEDDDDDDDEIILNSSDNMDSLDQSFQNESSNDNQISDLIMKDLNEYCESFTGFAGLVENKSQSKINQAIHHVSTLLKYFENGFDDDQSVTDSLMKIEKQFITDKLQSLQASTIKAYIQDFKQFLIWAKLWKKTWITFESATRIESLINIWTKKLKQLILKRASEKKLQDRESALSQAHFTAYFQSQNALNAQKIFFEIAQTNDDGFSCSITYCKQRFPIWRFDKHVNSGC
jgi:hypothetical protein